MTGQLEEEKMQVYVRLGIRLLYKVTLFSRSYQQTFHPAYRARKVEWKEPGVCIYHTLPFLVLNAY